MAEFSGGRVAPVVRAHDVGAPAAHPSEPIPVQGRSVGHAVRAALGETGLTVFPVILGGAEFGWNVDIATSHGILDRYIERGGNAVHTADSYAGGRSEHIIGEWLRTRGNRDDVVVSTRVGTHPDNPGLGPVNLVRAVEASLTRLGTDRIDVLYLAGDDMSVPLEETLATAEWLVGAGKVRHLAAAGFPAEKLVEARILSSAGYPRVTVLDVHYNVVHRSSYEGDVRLVVGAQGIAVTPSHPLAHGFLSGRHRRRERLGTSARGVQVAAYLNRRGQRVLKALDTVAQDVDAPDAAVAVAWLLAQRAVVAPIVNAYAPEHVDELVQGVGVQLGRGHLAELSRAAQ
ncbi:aldo/keto reductase [Microbacterium sp. LRZ72]|uniref:aldo/keto reductase n=1 Tax=Microbacterium sp. LRZ72 TaxID=2942481 RepID=UPI0029B8D6ED|nr:aldo/keto reductase [Microbacterium sp. LRZ72]MDX2377432.1 aldo/keto reductase [Microbacterium sp. LRZ72]